MKIEKDRPKLIQSILRSIFLEQWDIPSRFVSHKESDNFKNLLNLYTYQIKNSSNSGDKMVDWDIKEIWNDLFSKEVCFSFPLYKIIC